MDLKHLRSFQADWQLDLTLSGFFNRVEDRIILTESAPAQYHYENLAEWRTMGSSFTAGMKKGAARLRSSVVLTGYFNSLSEEEDGVPALSWSPDWVNDLTIGLLKERAGISIWHKMTGKTPYFFTQNNEMLEGVTEGWHLLNASLNGNFWNNKIRVVTGVKNLLDVQQIRAGATGTHSSGDGLRPAHWGRSFFVQATFLLASKQ